MKNNFFGFTLSEILITLGIIGVVASLTIPNLTQTTKNKELVSQYLKINNILSNALKETEAVTLTKFYNMSEEGFKNEFESHLKTQPCTGKVCLIDGAYFTYGTFDDTCPNNICMELTVDTNGKRGPNTAGKDIFTMLLTKKGLRALGESNTCETGLDCGAYVLANHKLYEGEVDIAEVPIMPEPIPQGCVDAGCRTCTDGYKSENGLCVEKTMKDLNNDAITACKSENSSVCKLPNGLELTNFDGVYTTPQISKNDWPVAQTQYSDNDYTSGAKKYCESLGLSLPNKEQLYKISEYKGSGSVLPEKDVWLLSSEVYDAGSNKYYGLNTEGAGWTERSCTLGFDGSLDNARFVCVGK